MQHKIITYFRCIPWGFSVAPLLRLLERLQAKLRRETYALPLDLFRVVGGLLCGAYFVTLCAQAADFSAPDGLLDHVLLRQIFWFTRLSVFFPGLSLPLLQGIFCVGCVGAVGIVLGYHIKRWAGLLFVIAVSTYRWNFPVMYVDDAFIHLFLFWLLLLPVGHTLCWRDFWSEGAACLARWSQRTVPGLALYCLLANICLIYLIAGVWKWTSPLWQQGFALYATLRLPIAYAPDLWQPQHLPMLRVFNYAALIVEPLIPLLLLWRVGHPLKWVGLFLQGGFHLGILLTLPVPFVNLGLLGTSLLFFREEIVLWCQQGISAPVRLRQAVYVPRPGKLALVFLVVLSLAVARGIPVLGSLYQPAYAALWIVGVAQEYHLFDWIDKMNYHVTYRVSTQSVDGTIHTLDSTSLFPQAFRARLLQAYLHNVRWMPVPSQHRPALKYSILHRFAQRFCQRQPLTPSVTAWARVQRIHPGNPALTQGVEQFVMTFRCAESHVILCENFLGYPPDTACKQRTSGGAHSISTFADWREYW